MEQKEKYTINQHSRKDNNTTTQRLITHNTIRTTQKLAPIRERQEIEQMRTHRTIRTTQYIEQVQGTQTCKDLEQIEHSEQL